MPALMVQTGKLHDADIETIHARNAVDGFFFKIGDCK